MSISFALSVAIAAFAAFAVPAAGAVVTVATPPPAAAFCPGCSDADAGIADTVFAPATPADLPERRRFPIDRERGSDGVAAGLALDGTLAIIPEPRVWALLIAGYALVGFALRRRGWARRVAV